MPEPEGKRCYVVLVFYSIAFIRVLQNLILNGTIIPYHRSSLIRTYFTFLLYSLVIISESGPIDVHSFKKINTLILLEVAWRQSKLSYCLSTPVCALAVIALSRPNRASVELYSHKSYMTVAASYELLFLSAKPL